MDSDAGMMIMVWMDGWWKVLILFDRYSDDDDDNDKSKTSEDEDKDDGDINGKNDDNNNHKNSHIDYLVHGSDP